MQVFTRHANLAAIAIVVLAGCAKGGETPVDAPSPMAPPAVVAPPGGTAQASAAKPVANGVARKEEVKNDTYEFDYAYPAQAGAIRGLKTLLDGELDRTRAELASEAGSGQVDAKKNDYPFHAYSTDKRWSMVTDLPNWLSLSATIYTFTGGAHGMTVFDTMVWDKHAGVRRDPLALFTSKAAFRAAVAKPMCAALDRERHKRRGDDGYPADDAFAKCIDPIDDATIILGSSSHQRFDRVGFLIPPYSAGPYAEGTYELTLPVTPALLAAVKREYRDAFAAP